MQPISVPAQVVSESPRGCPRRELPEIASQAGGLIKKALGRDSIAETRAHTGRVMQMPDGERLPYRMSCRIDSLPPQIAKAIGVEQQVQRRRIR